ncbi:hypothetical protein CSV60_12810 [Sporosarcina sp. P7]|nr:hypothetical protein CSV60_12810 [Sporosarcina sp. P7]
MHIFRWIKILFCLSCFIISFLDLFNVLGKTFGAGTETTRIARIVIELSLSQKSHADNQLFNFQHSIAIDIIKSPKTTEKDFSFNKIEQKWEHLFIVEL